MICWMFPGQPIVFPDTYTDAPGFREVARLCQQVSGFNPLERATSAGTVSESVRLQLFGTCISLYRSWQLVQQNRKPQLIAEHSMGIYSALAAAGSIDGKTALELTGKIGECMARMGGRRKYALGCVIGMTAEPLEAIAAATGVHIANYNTSRHFLLAGELLQIESALAKATAEGAFSASIHPCDAPLHTPLISEISGELQRIVSEYIFSEPAYPVMEHIGQTFLTAATIPEFLVDELRRPVCWDKTYQALCRQGVTDFREVGAGSALAKFNRWISSES